MGSERRDGAFTGNREKNPYFDLNLIVEKMIKSEKVSK